MQSPPLLTIPTLAALGVLLAAGQHGCVLRPSEGVDWRAAVDQADHAGRRGLRTVVGGEGLVARGVVPLVDQLLPDTRHLG